MNNKFMNLNNPQYSYMLAFLQCDGHLRESTRNRGRLSVEIKYIDRHILKSFAALTPYNSFLKTRTRDTNFKKEYKSAIWNLYNWDARKKLQSLGLSAGKKSNIIAPPKVKFSKRDYVRGLIDADGSVGITKYGFPFISFTTASENMKKFMCDYVYEVVGYRPNIKRNKRDNIYNINLFRELAQALIANIYYENCLSLKRKYRLATKALKWRRLNKSNP